MPRSWSPFCLSPQDFKRGSEDLVNLIPIMYTPIKSEKPEANSLELPQQQSQSQQQRTLRHPLQRYHTAVPTTYIHSLNLSFSQPGDYNVSVKLSGDVTIAPDAAIMAQETKPVTDVSQPPPALGSATKVKEAPAVLATCEDDMFETAVA